MEQDVAADPGDSKKCFVGKRFESYDDMMAMIDALKLHNHPLRVFNSQTVEECNKRSAKAKQSLEPGKWKRGGTKTRNREPRNEKREIGNKEMEMEMEMVVTLKSPVRTHPNFHHTYSYTYCIRRT